MVLTRAARGAPATLADSGARRRPGRSTARRSGPRGQLAPLATCPRLRAAAWAPAAAPRSLHTGACGVARPRQTPDDSGQLSQHSPLWGPWRRAGWRLRARLGDCGLPGVPLDTLKSRARCTRRGREQRGKRRAGGRDQGRPRVEQGRQHKRCAPGASSAGVGIVPPLLRRAWGMPCPVFSTGVQLKFVTAHRHCGGRGSGLAGNRAGRAAVAARRGARQSVCPADRRPGARCRDRAGL